MKKKSELYRNEIKSYIVRAGMTMSEVVDYLADEHGWSSSVPNLSGKLKRGSLRYGEAVELADALTRSERTHRLCTRAGMLETFLREPTILTDDDVMELLTFIFHSEAVQRKLDLLIKNRKNELATDEG